MKLTNEQLLEAFRAADLAFMVAAFAHDNGGVDHSDWRDEHLRRVGAHAATLPEPAPNQLETESLQLSESGVVDANKKVGHSERDTVAVDCYFDKPQFEVGGTCDQGRIVHIEPSGLLTIVDSDSRTVFHERITNYKPPVRVKVWRLRGTGDFTMQESWADRHYGSDAIEGYWTPEVSK